MSDQESESGPPIFDARVRQLAEQLNEYFMHLPIPEGGQGQEGAYRALAALYYAAALAVESAETVEAAREFKEAFAVNFSVCCNALIGTKFPGTAEAVVNAAIPLVTAMKEEGIIP